MAYIEKNIILFVLQKYTLFNRVQKSKINKKNYLFKDVIKLCIQSKSTKESLFLLNNF